MAGKKRQANFEWLRVIAMLMVIALHYLNKGGAAVSYVNDGSVRNHAAWLVDSFCLVAVNVYVLISGYFLAEKGFSPKKVFLLAAQVLFYSLLVPAVLAGCGIIDVSGWGIYDWLPFLFPFGTEHYWFATAYLGMYLFSPLLAAAADKLDRKQLRGAILALVLFYSLEKSLLPFQLATDQYGYDVVWFLCLFLTAVYLKRYGLPFLSSKGRAFGLYIGASLLGFAASAVVGLLAARTGIGALSYYADMVYSYNYVLCLLAAVGLFEGFRRLEVPEGRMAGLARRLGPLTFGVYLLHENLAVRELWPVWLGAEKVKDSFLFLPHLAVCVLLVFAAGIVTDFVRAGLFAAAGRAAGRLRGPSGKKREN